MLALKDELITNKKKLEDYVIGIHNSNVKFNKVLQFSVGANPEVPIDSLRQYLTEMIFLYALPISNTVQEEAIASGKFKLLSDSLKQTISKLRDNVKSREMFFENADMNLLTNENDNNRVAKLITSLSIIQEYQEKFSDLDPVPIHPEFKKNDAELIDLVKAPDTCITLYKWYRTKITDESWIKRGLLDYTNMSIELIGKELRKQ
ncbi:hypothetical protein GM418_14105 [Maribellus comscasis]|uniref:Uncharacterized protein n=1 Tax=Maribellus comscasis TaxID=2681766 RepID=A0A6I6JU17_9BACT|nr:hypothetical protein [Maribellus comscasis]QGY44759.1 hypothetical protein GM418_14105 [Maribellus comscasis]